MIHRFNIGLARSRERVFRVQDWVSQLRGEYTDKDTVPAPTPSWAETSAMGRDLVHGPLALHEQYGDVFRSRIGPGLYPMLVTRDPEHIDQVLVRNRQSYRKGIVLRWLRTVFNNSILVSEGEHWRKQRRIMAPSFTRRALADYAEIFVRKTDEALDLIEPGVPFAVNDWTMKLTLDIVLECLFGAELDARRIQMIEDGLEDGLFHVDKVIGGLLPPPPMWVPTASNRAVVRARKRFITLVDELIANRRRSGEERKDLLGLLLAARDEDGQGLSDDELREEVITLLLAGHETTALNIAYTLMLLGWDDALRTTIQDELSDVVGDGVPGVEHLDALKKGSALLHESLRLFPPAAVISRQATEDQQVGDYHVPAYSHVLIPIRAVHYDPRWYPDPEKIDLSRWLDDAAADRPRQSFLPFGGGNRICIGNRFALMESQLVTARILQRFHPVTVNQEVPPLKLTITLRPTEPLMMQFDAR